MPLPKEILEEMGAKRRREALLADQDRVRDLVVTGARCVAWALLGILPILWSASTTSLILGRIAFWGGLLVGNTGIVFTLLGAYRRGEARGDW